MSTTLKLEPGPGTYALVFASPEEAVVHVGKLGEIRLRPEEYRRLWAAIRADFALDEGGRVQRIDHPGYGCCDAFYRATGKASALRTCNDWAAGRLRLAGIRTSLWPPFVQGLTWRYRRSGQST